MGRLDGFSYRDVAQRLRQFGFVPAGHQRGSHEAWVHPQTGVKLILPRHARDLPGGTLRAILRQAGIAPDDFLAD